ncbi:hypothetical protein [Arthrobacter oryzae]|uniref:hypothetical protein n=1 Tax=Arthrobacter oryzae TaxID=409290 RepID=UPI0028577717|nr:hypothetical protein [Arthrobacter oryzae]MDR6508061.1 hypothetical protein [Arthrobacter oryzae]
MHTLLDGLVSALIGAAAALLVLWVTVKTQNAGIQRQITAQAVGLSEQIRVQGEGLNCQLAEQRRENARTREHEAAAQVIDALNRLLRGDSRIDHRGNPSEAITKTLLEVTTGFQRLRLDLAMPDEAVIEAFRQWTYLLESVANRHREFVVKSVKPETAHNTVPLELQDALGELNGVAEFIVKYLIQYVRAGESARQSMAATVMAAFTAYHLDRKEFYLTYMHPATARVPHQDLTRLP